jgi:hypothetical protein
MRSLPSLLLVFAACVHARAPFYPATPEAAVPGQPEAAASENAGVRLTVHAGDWRGTPEDLEDRLTPVEVYVENESGRTIRIGPEHFGLLGQNGFRYRALDAREVQAAFAEASRGSIVYYGAYGAYPWPGFWRPYRHRIYPYMGFGWYGPPAAAWVQGVPAAQAPPPAPRGTLDSGGNVSLLVFFPVPAKSLGAIEISMTVEDTAGQSMGVVRVPLDRQPLRAPPPAPSTAPPPGPSTPPPPPPPQK